MDPYRHTDQILHLTCQLLAKANRSFVPAQKDDSHTNLYYDPLCQRITGRWLQSDSGSILVTLNLHNQTLEFLSPKHEIVAELPTLNHSLPDIEAVAEKKFAELGFDAEDFKRPLHFEITNYPFAKEALPSLPEVNAWMHYRQLANEACHLLLGHAQIEGEIRIWPHHFDTGIYIPLQTGLGIGFGLAMEDEMAGAPYFYMSGYPNKESLHYQNLPENDFWQWEVNENWQGAILTLHTLSEMDYAGQKKALRHYMDKVFHWFLHQ
jgi:hypothetical protein